MSFFEAVSTFFCNILAVSGLRFLLMHNMSQTLETEIENAMDQEADAAPTTKDRKTHRSGSGKPRAEARPYKKYDLPNLQGKITKMKKQVELQRSKLLLLEDKLEKHEKEVSLRGGEPSV